ncbi:MAG: Uncharacterised protein [SAR116 cluster bacterium]|nr:MAG: Uncharacterised protein [SAR116 cluster bacterium]
MGNLEGAQQPLAKQFMRRQAGNILAIKQDMAACRGIMTGNHVEQGGLARTIGTNQARNRTGFNGQRDIIDSPDTAKILRDVLDSYHIHITRNKTAQAKHLGRIF